METYAVRAEGLSKAYRIGHLMSRYPTFREAIATGWARSVGSLLRPRLSRRSSERFWALKHVSFEIRTGEVVGIIGLNGAGKSTLLKILSRITEPTSGRAELRGRAASLLEVGSGFHPELTGRENVYLNGAILGMHKAEIDARFDEIVAFAEVERFLDTPVKHYSSGMYMRLAFAVAAHLEPEILIIDEVLSVGDAGFQKKCLGKMGAVASREGRTVLFVSHNLAAVRSLCSRSLVLQKGELAFEGSAEEGVNWYLQRIGGDEPRTSVTFPPEACDGPRMTAARLLADGQESSDIDMGTPLALEVYFASPHLVRAPKLGYVIYSFDGQGVVNANNRFIAGPELPFPIAGGRIRCDLGVVPLMAGRYTVSLWLGDHAHDSHVEQNALAFDVHERDVWGSGRVPPPKVSSLWWPTRFHIEPHDGSQPSDSWAPVASGCCGNALC